MIRNGLFDRYSIHEIVRRYSDNYNLKGRISIEEVIAHTILEGQLADRLLASSKQERAQIFENCYNQLYSELPWLVSSGNKSGGEVWNNLIKPNSKIYEIGSGAGYLINYLANKGHSCTGTDVSSERVKNSSSSIPKNKVTWAVTDGINLSNNEVEGTYDYVISDQVIEHMHPDDIVKHFFEAKLILKKNGEYLVRTPNAMFGPADLSRVFGLDKPIFMHLKEYSFQEITIIAKSAGFSSVTAIFAVGNYSKRSKFYSQHISLIEMMANSPKRAIFRKFVTRFRKYLLLSTGIFVSLKV